MPRICRYLIYQYFLEVRPVESERVYKFYDSTAWYPSISVTTCLENFRNAQEIFLTFKHNLDFWNLLYEVTCFCEFRKPFIKTRGCQVWWLEAFIFCYSYLASYNVILYYVISVIVCRLPYLIPSLQLASTYVIASISQASSHTLICFHSTFYNI